MKPITFIIAALCCPVFVFCQDITGLWKGTMYNDSTKQSLEYEIVIRKEKGKFIGYSHTSYLLGTTTYYGVKKINVRVAKDGKIVMQDAKWLETNYPGEQSKNVIQLNVLDMAKSGEESYMDGLKELQLEILGDFRGLPQHVIASELEDFGKLESDGHTLHRFRVGDYRIYFERHQLGVLVHRVLSRHTLKDFFFRSGIKLGEDQQLQENPKFWELIEAAKTS